MKYRTKWKVCLFFEEWVKISIQCDPIFFFFFLFRRGSWYFSVSKLGHLTCPPPPPIAENQIPPNPAALPPPFRRGQSSLLWFLCLRKFGCCLTAVFPLLIKIKLKMCKLDKILQNRCLVSKLHIYQILVSFQFNLYIMKMILK